MWESPENWGRIWYQIKLTFKCNSLLFHSHPMRMLPPGLPIPCTHTLKFILKQQRLPVSSSFLFVYTINECFWKQKFSYSFPFWYANVHVEWQNVLGTFLLFFHSEYYFLKKVWAHQHWGLLIKKVLLYARKICSRKSCRFFFHSRMPAVHSWMSLLFN